VSTNDDLAALRSEIDEIDRGIVELLARRLDVCRRVADVKSKNATSIIQPERVRQVLTSRRQWAIDEGIDADFAEQIFRTLLSETHRIEVALERPEAAPVKVAEPSGDTELDTVACRIDVDDGNDHVVDAARTFFSKMGFRVEATDDPAMFLAEAGGVTVVLLGAGDDPAVRAHLDEYGSGVQHIAIEVLNAGFTQQALARTGVPLLTDVIVDQDGHEQLFTVLDPATGVQLGFISRTGHRLPMSSHNVRALFTALHR
jgi:4-amino-4-deoxychorismate mutase